MTTSVCLFAGIGATAKGQRDLGRDVIVVEKNETAVETLRANGFDTKPLDVKKLAFRGIHADAVLGGPPCQPFSQSAGDAVKGQYDERDCIPDFIRAVSQIQPRFFLMEEVWTLTWKKHRTYFDTVLADLRAAGYDVEYRVLVVSDHTDVAQARKRLFVLGRRDGQPIVWPERSPLHVPTPMAKALGWDVETAMARADQAPVYGWPQWVFERPSTTVVGTYRPEVQSPPGYRTAGMGPRQNQPGAVVTTLAEALTLQGLPADWKVAGTEAQKRLQVGNACPPAMTKLLTTLNA